MFIRATIHKAMSLRPAMSATEGGKSDDEDEESVSSAFAMANPSISFRGMGTSSRGSVSLGELVSASQVPYWFNAFPGSYNSVPPKFRLGKSNLALIPFNTETLFKNGKPVDAERAIVIMPTGDISAFQGLESNMRNSLHSNQPHWLSFLSSPQISCPCVVNDLGDASDKVIIQVPAEDLVACVEYYETCFPPAALLPMKRFFQNVGPNVIEASLPAAAGDFHEVGIRSLAQGEHMAFKLCLFHHKIECMIADDF